MGALLMAALVMGCDEPSGPDSERRNTHAGAAVGMRQPSRDPQGPEKSNLTATTQPDDQLNSASSPPFPAPPAASDAKTPSPNTRAPLAAALGKRPVSPAGNGKGATVSSAITPPADLLERAKNGESLAQRDLGKFYADHGQLRDAVQWYWEAASQGDAEAQRILGLAYLFGQGVVRDMEEAGNWLLLSAMQNDAIAQRELGKIFGDQWRFEESNDWLLKAALQGDAEAQRMLGMRYTIGQGVESDRQEAVKWFHQAANQGDALAQRELGKYYGELWNLQESNKWYLMAAENGDVRAQHMMGVRCTFGQGVERDLQKAGQWFLLAAEQGDAQSQYSIGLRWLRGEVGEPRDFAEAAKWFQLAAEQGLDQAQLSLGRRYAQGEGVEQDLVEAYKWVALAQEQGKVKGAGKAVSEMATQMTGEQIEEARARAAAFSAKSPSPISR